VVATEGGLLDSFGIRAESETVWRELLLSPRANLGDIADACKLPVDEVEKSLEELLDARLLRRADSTLGVAAIDPKLSVETHIAVEERRVAERAAMLASLRARIPEVTAEYERGRAASGEQPGFEVVTGLEKIRKQLYLSSDLAVGEVRSITNVPALEPLIHAEPVDFRALDRGVQMRTIISACGLNDPDVYQALLRRARKGEEIRTMAEAPTEFVVVGTDLAALAVDSRNPELGAIFVRVPSIVGILIFLFDELWMHSAPVFGDPASLPQGRSGRILALLALGATDVKISRTLGIGVRTVRRDVSDLKQTLGAASRAEVVAAAARKGWL
jgi:DNA-binding CsgD family transcriptional regulator